MIDQFDFLQFASEHYKKKLPFVLYSKPLSKLIIGLFQSDSMLHFLESDDESGFVIAPFHGKQMILFPKSKQKILISQFVEDNFQKAELRFQDDSKDMKNFVSLVKNGIASIQNNFFQKVVLSRQIKYEYPNLDLLKSFIKSVEIYPNAFNYLFFHPKIGSWLGATPEQLVKIQDKNYETVSLAGTQVFHDGIIQWENKERVEQEIVTDYIKNSVLHLSNNVQIQEPFSVQAGHLAHIKTIIKGVLKPNVNSMELIRVLHPTPAVCGFPKNEAMKFILENEGYDRGFYTGFLGELQHDFEKDLPKYSDLFVNLRCLKFSESQVNLFVGCGITKASQPEKEYLETQHKLQIMQKILT